ncbi:MAG: VTT domain-containing protein [Clostridia bacterium]
MEKQKVKVFKLTMTILAIAIIVGIIIYMFPVMRELSTKEGQLAFKEKVSSSGILGLLMLFALQVAQIFLIIIPGEPIEILAGMCYGPIWGTVFIMASAGIISTIIFFLVRKYGKRFVYNFCDKEKVAKIENSKLFKNPNKIEMIMFILFLLPGTPKDLLVYIAGLLPINPVKFVLISVFARFPSVISSTLAGANLAVGDWKKSIVMYLAIVLVAIIVILIANKFDKDKLAEKAIKTIK